MQKPGLLVLLLICCAGLAFAQPENPSAAITIQKKKIKIGTLLNEITQQSGLQFSYNPESIDPKEEVSFAIVGATLEETLDLLASKIPIEYSLIEEQIVLNYKSPPLQEGLPEPEFFTISGFVNDKASGESLLGASVFVAATSQGTNTNAFGFYSLRLPKGNYELAYSYVGFETETVNVQLYQDKKEDKVLGYTSEELPSVIVKIPLRNLLERKQLGQMELTPEELENMPEFGGESGIIKGLQTLPGIKTHSDGSSYFFIRGGAKDQNLIIIDDAPIFNPAHLFGFYSIVVPEFTKSIKVYKSDIPVNMGDRLSSIVDIRTKDGNLNKWEFNGAYNPLIYRLSIEGPIINGKSAVFLSLRQSSFSGLIRRLSPNAKVGFGDFNFKWNYKLNKNNRLFFTMISSRDELLNEADPAKPAGVKWGNFTSTLRWNHLFGSKLFSNTVLYTGSYGYELSGGGNSWKSGIGKISLKSDFTHYANPKLTTKFGLELQAYGFNSGEVSGEALAKLFPKLSQGHSRQSALYFNTKYQWSDRWQFSAGLRMTNWQNWGPIDSSFVFNDNHEVIDTISIGKASYQAYSNIDPRLSIQYQIDSTSNLKGTYGLYHQYMQLISNSASPFTSVEVWLPSGPNIKPQLGHQVTLSYLKYFPKPKLEFGAELYYKKMENQIDYKPHASTVLNPLLEGELRFGEMESYGLELMLKKNFGKLTGWMSYTLSRSLRQTNEVNGGRIYPAFHDRPHDFSLTVNYQINPRILWSTYWTAYTGSAISAPTGFYRFNDNIIPIYGEKNNARLPSYNRVDLAFKFILNKRPDSRYQHSLTLSMYNALFHKNIVAVEFAKSLDENGTPLVRTNFIKELELVNTRAELIRFLPSLTYKFKL